MPEFSDNRMLTLAIAGASAGGKSAIAETLVRLLGSERANILALDNYYNDLSHLPVAAREWHNFDRPQALDIDLFVRHVEGLKKGHCIKQPIYDFTNHCRLKQTSEVCPRSVLILEGLLIASDDRLDSLYDTLVFVETSCAVRWSRRLERDLKTRGRDEASINAFWSNAEENFSEHGGRAFKKADLFVHGDKALVENASRILDSLALSSSFPRMKQ